MGPGRLPLPTLSSVGWREACAGRALWSPYSDQNTSWWSNMLLTNYKWEINKFFLDKCSGVMRKIIMNHVFDESLGNICGINE